MIESTSTRSVMASAAFAARAARAAPDSARAADTRAAATAADGASVRAAKTDELTAQEQQQVAQLKQIDRQVRAHEQAHLSVGGDLVRGGASFTYQTGPDQQRYAVAGEVSIDVSPASTPQETLPKAAHIRAAALAPADPSVQDQSVAAQAERMAGEARIEIAALRMRESSTASGNTGFYSDAGQNSGLGGRLDLFA